jgi:hypothetical protein
LERVVLHLLKAARSQNPPEVSKTSERRDGEAAGALSQGAGGMIQLVFTSGLQCLLSHRLMLSGRVMAHQSLAEKFHQLCSTRPGQSPG